MEGMQEGATAGLRDLINDLLSDDGPSAELSVKPSDMATNSHELPAYLKVVPMDYEKEKTKATAVAQKAMDSLLKFYLRSDVIDDNEYIRAKAAVESAKLASLIHHIETSEHAITTLLKQIHAGSFQPRMWEVLASLQKSLIDMMKFQTMQMVANEESFKRLRADLDHNPSTPAGLPPSTGGGVATRGARDLMKNIQDEIKAEFDGDEGNDGDDDT